MKILSAVLALGAGVLLVSNVAKAHEYKRWALSANCTVSANEQTLKDPKKAIGSKQYSFVRYDVVNEKYDSMASCIQGAENVPFEIDVTLRKSSMRKAYKGKTRSPVVRVEFEPTIDSDTVSLRQVLVDLGAQNIPDLSDAKVERVKGEGYSRNLVSKKSDLREYGSFSTEVLGYQIHFSKGKNAGKSYHILFQCGGSQDYVETVPCE